MTTPQIEAFNQLSNDDKLTVIQMGIESLLRAYTLNTAGLTTLKGAMFYISPKSASLCDVMLHALNGSNAHRKMMSDFFNEEKFRSIAETLQPIAFTRTFNEHPETPTTP